MTENYSTTDVYGNIWLSERALIDAIYQNKKIDGCFAFPTDDVSKYNKYNRVYGTGRSDLVTEIDTTLSVEEFHKSRQQWQMPDKYRDINLADWFRTKISNSNEQDRVNMELALYEEKGLTDILKLMIYITETLRANEVVWGVGRGSSVASYCLYLIGVHRINSLKFNLDIKEFLK